jgi:monothiol glutaredoxin
MTPTRTVEDIQAQVQQLVTANKICIFSKGTKDAPRCGFTLETKEFFEKYNVPFEMVDVLDDMEMREVLTQMTNWRTLPKVFINGKFYGDTDVLVPMAESGELQDLLKEAFAA